MAQSLYANYCAVVLSENDACIKFRWLVPTITNENTVRTTIETEQNIVLSPIQFKKLLLAMQRQLENHEKQYGLITVKTEALADLQLEDDKKECEDNTTQVKTNA